MSDGDDGELVVNPQLVVWPGEQLHYFMAINGRFGQLAPLDAAVIPILRAFLKPRTAQDVFGRLSRGLRSSLEVLRSAHILVSARRSMGKHWAGFRFHDHRRLIDFSSIVLTRNHEMNGRAIKVFDETISTDTTHSLAAWFHASPFRRLDIDQQETLAIKHWFLPIGTARSSVAAVPLLAQLDRVARSAFPSMSLEVLETKAYSTPYGDLPSRHRDNDSTATVTAVLFGNDRWEDIWGGELLFDNGSEPIYAVQPRPARMVVFRGDIWHRAGAPTRAAMLPRYSLVIRYDVL